MKRQFKILASICTIAAIGIVGTSWADPTGSQRLRGLGDRVFLVTVEVTSDPFGLLGLPIGTTFPNCYIFAPEPDGDGNNWFETAFPDTKGVWTQDSTGAKTSYVVTAQTAEGFPVSQLGQVTPARGRGVLQIVADSFVFPGEEFALGFLSVGEEIDASEKGTKCPDFPMPTFPE